MNLAVGMLLLGMVMLGSAYAAETSSVKTQQRTASSHRAKLPVAERRKEQKPAAAVQLETVKTENGRVPLLDEQKAGGLESPAEPAEQAVQLKGVRG